MLSVTPSGRAFLLATSGLLFGCCSCSLLAHDIPHIAAYFGTKSRYEEVNPHLQRDAFSVNRSVLRAPASERCSPVHLSALIRHGSRYPTVKNIRRIRSLSELVRRESSGGSEDWLQDIQSRWENWFTDDMDGELVGVFWLDHKAVQLHRTHFNYTVVSTLYVYRKLLCLGVAV